MNVIQATGKDAEILAKLNWAVQKIHADQHPHLFKYPVDQTQLTAFFQDQLASEKNGFFIAWDGEEPLGYIWCILQERPENMMVHAFKRVSIEHISVNPESRGKGVGERLMQQAESFAREKGTINMQLSVWAFNSHAQGFFERLGYGPYMHSMWKTLEI